MHMQSQRKRYPSDLTDAPWDLLAPLIPEVSPNTTQETLPRREIVNSILYVLRIGCSWRQMPHDLVNGKTAYHYFRQWKLNGTWEQAMTHLRKRTRRAIEQAIRIPKQLSPSTVQTRGNVLIEPLSTREQEVRELLAQGASNQEIAQALAIVPNTVKRHVHSIYGK